MTRPLETEELAISLASDHAAAQRRAEEEAVIRRFGWITDSKGWVTKAYPEGRAAFGKPAYIQQQRVLCNG